ncbi:hypothetical protein [Nocardioides nanhaiensis]|uniref:Uncharacterized protein n=1 Tax=Nocardioides nanhaiensis TaxID=1476871 RepID=A0ABP8WDL3_9ACTN
MTLLPALTVLFIVWTAVTLPVGAWRLLAYRSGQVDHTPGMRNVAYLALTLAGVGLVGLAVCVVLLLATRG